ncbi:sulfatase family protein [Pontiella sulfatireligans]|uniref:Arylsulfatase n=1 Tax=Pontiella sulfatireligans TaxID=2750658 RepID=A0A6C2ULE2_9BACT|nr:sulfatase [Pontiella sulfatireligans]SPS74444.1 sulfatase S1_11 [Kiritimatiellales bacterium]VGO20789.1 Arylsulfatase [Pontiella sulfatireligans]
MKRITIALLLSTLGFLATEAAERPNILFLFSDDHALNAISAYGGPLAEVAPTPNIDRLATSGAVFENSFVANSICGPSRACILTGKHSHKNGFLYNSGNPFDGTQWTVASALNNAGYATAVIGKWHLKSTPVGFDHWEVYPGQGQYYNPIFLQMDGSTEQAMGYATDVTTDKAIDWLDSRDKNKPFFLMCQHKAPHRTFSPALRHLGAFDGITIPEPDNLFDDYATRSRTLPGNEMEIGQHMHWMYDLKLRKDEHTGVTLPGPDQHPAIEYNRMTDEQKTAWDAYFGPLNKKFLAEFNKGKMSKQDVLCWKYQRYIKNYLSTVKSVDENIGRMLDYLEENGLAENTIVIYSSDQGFYLGEHGWFDKRWMFEESFKMPFLISWPGVIKPGSRPQELIQNIDYAPTFAEAAGITVPSDVQGMSLLPVFKGEVSDWRKSVYYAYYEVGEHNVPVHFGVRTKQHKLIHFPATDEWNLFDLEADPCEMKNLFDNPEYANVQKKMTAEYYRVREYYDAPAWENELQAASLK